MDSGSKQGKAVQIKDFVVGGYLTCEGKQGWYKYRFKTDSTILDSCSLVV